MSPPAQRLLVTGGRGRLAALVAGHFSPSTCPVTRFSRREGDGLEPLEALFRPATLAGAGAVLHLAWSTLPAQAERDPGAALREDLPLLERLLAALAAVPKAVRPLLVFFSSGGTIYGDAPGRPSREEDPCRPLGAYGRAKLAAEQCITTAAAQHGLAVAILRVSNPYGYPVPAERQQGLIPHAVRCALAGQPLALWGDGSARKDFLHCSDLLAALEVVLARRLTGTFNVAAGESHAVHEVIGLVQQATGRPLPLAPAPAPAWDVHDSRLDHRRLVAATGWSPQVPLAEGIRRAVAAETAGSERGT